MSALYGHEAVWAYGHVCFFDSCQLVSKEAFHDCIEAIAIQVLCYLQIIFVFFGC